MRPSPPAPLIHGAMRSRAGPYVPSRVSVSVGGVACGMGLGAPCARRLTSAGPRRGRAGLRRLPGRVRALRCAKSLAPESDSPAPVAVFRAAGRGVSGDGSCGLCETCSLGRDICGPEKDRFGCRPARASSAGGRAGWAAHLEDVYLVTALVPSETACLASSPGSKSLTAVWISRDVMVDLLL